MQITGTHFNYYLLCQRKLWLFANGINMEHTSDLVYPVPVYYEEEKIDDFFADIICRRMPVIGIKSR